MTRTLKSATIALLALGAIGGDVSADRLDVLYADADTYLNVRIPDGSPGAASTVVIEEGYRKGQMTTDRGLLRFEIDAPADLIAEATLFLNSHGIYGWPVDPVEVELAAHAVLHAWSEDEATWRVRSDDGTPTYWDAYAQGVPDYGPGGGDFAAEPAAVFTVREEDTWSFIAVDVTAIVQDWQAGVLENHGLLLKFLEEREEPGDGTDRRGVDFISSENPSFPDHQPRLVIRLHIPGDLNDDNIVNQQDLGILLASYEIDDGGDVNGDGLTNQQDLGILLANYERTLP